MAKKNKLQTSKNKIDSKKLKKILLDAIEKRRLALKEYQETPTKNLLEKKLESIEWTKDTALMICAYNPEKEDMQFFSIKALATDLQAMCLYALHQAQKVDPSMCMIGVSTLIRQKQLNEKFAESLKPENIDEVKDEKNEQQ